MLSYRKFVGTVHNKIKVSVCFVTADNASIFMISPDNRAYPKPNFMKKKFFSFSAFALCIFSFSLLIFTGCQREIDNPNPGGGTTTNSGVNDNIMVSGGVRGTVIDENGQPVSGASVTSGGSITTTDRYGAFRFSNINLSKENGYVKVTKQGYFMGTRTFASTAGRTHNVRIQLIPKTNTGTFSGTSGGTITLSGGGKLVMPANAVTDATGTPYTGTVNVAMTWIDPTSQNLSDIVPGDLRGITTAGEERGLETFGMLGVELTGPGGQALKVATGKTAELTFPVPAALSGTAPATIDLWHFDEATGRWKQEGSATKTGSNYIAQVSHFSFWNCDAPFPLINLCMSFVNAANNQQLNNVQIRIKRPNGSYGYGRTDSAGNLCGKVPKNEVLTLEVLGQCNNVAYSQTIGPFSADATLPTVSATIAATNTLTITGTVTNCAGANVISGVAVIYVAGGYSYSVPVVNGVFTHTMIRCNSNDVNVSVMGIDYTTQQQGNPVGGTGTTGTLNIGTVQACGTSSAQYVELLIDGSPINFTAPPDIISSGDTLNSAGPIRISAYRVGSGPGGTTTTTGFNLSFANPTGITGSFPIISCSVIANMAAAQQIVSLSPMVNITTFGPPVTGFIVGNFSIQMMFSTGPKNVTGTFRVKRN